MRPAGAVFGPLFAFHNEHPGRLRTTVAPTSVGWALFKRCECPHLCRFSDAGETCSPRAHAAGVRKAPRHEIAVGRAPGVAASAMGIWAGRGCQCDLMAAVWMIALGQKIAESTLNARPVRRASGFGVGLRAGVARRCKRERCRARASQNGGGRCGGGSMVWGS